MLNKNSGRPNLNKIKFVFKLLKISLTYILILNITFYQYLKELLIKSFLKKFWFNYFKLTSKNLLNITKFSES